MGERADRLWVGEPGRLSPEDKERFREDRLRLVWSRFDCLVIFRNKELRFLSCPSLALVLLLRRAILDL